METGNCCSNSYKKCLYGANLRRDGFHFPISCHKISVSNTYKCCFWKLRLFGPRCHVQVLVSLFHTKRATSERSKNFLTFSLKWLMFFLFSRIARLYSSTLARDIRSHSHFPLLNPRETVGKFSPSKVSALNFEILQFLYTICLLFFPVSTSPSPPEQGPSSVNGKMFFLLFHSRWWKSIK